MRILETKVWSPKNIWEAWEMKVSTQNSSKFVAGGTFLQTKWEKGIPYPDHLVYLGEIMEYNQIYSLLENHSNTIHIGAFVKLSECKNHPLIQKSCSILSESIGSIAAPAVRNVGTVGGNIANGFGDTIPVLLVLEAEVTYFNGDEIKRDLLENWLKRDEESLLLEIIITEQKGIFNHYQFSKKIGRREAFTPSVVTFAGEFYMYENKVSYIRIAAGGGDTVPKRLKTTEMLVNHQFVDNIQTQAIYEEIIREYSPVTDAFFTADYRRKVAANLFMMEWENWREENG